MRWDLSRWKARSRPKRSMNSPGGSTPSSPVVRPRAITQRLAYASSRTVTASSSPLIEADPYFYNLLDHPNLAGIAEDLLGEDCIFYGSSDGQIHDGDTTWHRDGGSPEPATEAKLTFYLDEVAPGKGCLSFIPGSHLWPLHFNDLEKQIDEHVLGYPMQEFPGRYELHAGKGDVIAFQTRIWHSSWGGGANRRQMAWMMRTAPRMQWEIDSIAQFNKSYSEKWSKNTGRLISDRLFETADPRRMKKIQLLKDLGA